jgi:hypothetical protein
MAGTLMNIKKIMLIIVIAAALLTLAILILINIYFFREMPSASIESKEKPMAEEAANETTAAIPSHEIPAGQSIEDFINRANEKQKNLRDRELEAERVRNANRAEAFARQKELEASLLHAESQETAPSPLPKKETNPPSAEEMKALKEKGIISY